MKKGELLAKLRSARRNLEVIPLLGESQSLQLGVEAERLAKADDAIDRAMAQLRDLIDEIEEERE